MRHSTTFIVAIASLIAVDTITAQTANHGPPRHAGGPHVSPDGKHVLFYLDSAGHPQPSLMNSDGTSPSPLKIDLSGMSVANVTWLGSDRLLVLAAADRSSPRHVFVANLDGSNTKEIPVEAGVAFAMGVGNGSSMLVGIRGSDPQSFPTMRLIRVDGSVVQTIPSVSVPGRVTGFRVSGDGRRIALVAGIRDSADIATTMMKSSTLYVMNVDGTDMKSIATFSGMVELPAWSFDGTKIALQHDHPYAHDAHGAPLRPNDLDDDVMIVDVATGATHELTHQDGPYLFETPDWAPDGRLFVQSNKPGVMEVYRVNADGSNPVRLTK